MPAGRPSDYSPEIAERVLLRMYEGESLRTICADVTLPARSTVHLWRIRHAEFSVQYARARRAQVEARIEDANAIADDGSQDYIKTESGTQLNAEHVQRSKLRVEQRRWEASKLLRGPIDDAPLDYGERVQQEITGKDGGALQIVSTIPRPQKEE